MFCPHWCRPWRGTATRWSDPRAHKSPGSAATLLYIGTWGPTTEEGFIQKRRQRSSMLFGGQNLINSLLRHAIWMIWSKEWIPPILQIVLVQNSQRGKELKQLCPPNSSDDLCLLFCINRSSLCTSNTTKHATTTNHCIHRTIQYTLSRK